MPIAKSGRQDTLEQIDSRVTLRLTLTKKNRPSEIEETGPSWAKAAWKQTSAAQSTNQRPDSVHSDFGAI